jgi:LemA protein
MKKTGWIVLIVVLAFIGFSIMGIIGSYNGLVSKQEIVNQQWANVENVYQRRADLIPNLVNTVKGVVNFEQGTLTAVIEARAKATQMTIDPKNLTQEQLNKFQQNQAGVSQALGRLMVVVEKYPELKATANFTELQAQLEGTENRCTVERNKYNEVAQVYNTSRRSFPTIIIANMFGFTEKPYFKAEEGSDKAPQVQF